MRRERIDIPQDEIPRKWYNMLPDLPEPLPSYKDLETGREIRRLPEIYTRTASKLEFAEERWIDIPEAVTNAYVHCGRPTPLIRAHRLEEFLKTPARIYYKCEDLPPAGTFKTNTGLAQAYWAKKEDFKRTVSSGGSLTRSKFVHVFAAKIFGLTHTLFIPRAYCQENLEQAFFLTKMFEIDLLESPSSRTEVGRKSLRENPNHPGSAAIADAEVVEELMQSRDAVAIANSFLNHVLLTQTIMGLELEKQLESIDEKPNILVASVGSGSLLFGFIAPFVRDYLKKKLEGVRFLGAEPETSSRLTNGAYEYTGRKGPMGSFLVKAYQLHREASPDPISAAGIQNRNTAPLLSFLRHKGLIDTRVYPKDEKAIFEAARIFLQTEGRVLVPESAYAVRAVIDEALEAKKREEEMVIAACVSGTAYLDFGEKGRYADLG